MLVLLWASQRIEMVSITSFMQCAGNWPPFAFNSPIFTLTSIIGTALSMRVDWCVLRYVGVAVSFAKNRNGKHHVFHAMRRQLATICVQLTHFYSYQYHWDRLVNADTRPSSQKLRQVFLASVIGIDPHIDSDTPVRIKSKPISCLLLTFCQFPTIAVAIPYIASPMNM